MTAQTELTQFLTLEARAELALRQDVVAAIAAAQAARVEARRLGDALLVARAEALLGAAHLVRVEMDEGAALLEGAERVCRAHGDFVGLARCLLHLGYRAQTRGDYRTASRRFLELLERAQAQGSAKHLADAHNGLAMVFDSLGDVASSLEHQLAAITSMRALDDPPGLAALLANVSVDYRALGHLEEAERYCLEALTHARRHHDQSAALSARYNLGMAYLAQGRHGDALDAFGQTITQARAADLIVMLSWGLRGLGKVRLALGQRTEALAPLQEALRISCERGLRAEEGDVWLLLGRAQAQPEGTHSLRRALEIALETANTEAEARARRALAGALEEAGEAHAALVQLKRYIDLQDGRETRLLAQRAQVMAARFGTEEKERENLRLSVQARQDPLTGLANRRALEVQLAEALAHVGSRGGSLCLAMLDLDHFKQVNDRFAHRTGDEVLRACARLFQEGCRATDTVARFGGEEFVLLLPDTTLEDAAALLDRLRTRVRAHPWLELASGLTVTVSVGLAQAAPGSSADGLLADADAQLYRAKRAGRDVVVWSRDEAPLNLNSSAC